ncbi:replication protein A 70 kDa DNA-binding subunit B-like [Nicotiana tabacum]|uniref:Replication protein A 70 kDa DNA-binding subunit B-like n=1 Tax=Nicotiana tabacum TaxID=4097 RepID=A0AC58SRV8_TOBAC
MWGELAEKDGEIPLQLIDEKPVVAFCDVKGSIFQGDFCISTIHISSVLIHPTFQRAKEMQNWHDGMKAQNKDITLMPSKLIREAREVKIKDIINGSSATMKDSYRRFNARITTLVDKDEPWYSSCKKCYKKVNIKNKIVNCSSCMSENVDHEERYRLKIDVFDGDRHSNITLFDAARYLLGCDQNNISANIFLLMLQKED